MQFSIDELLTRDNKSIREVAPEQLEPLRSREAQVATWASERSESAD